MLSAISEFIPVKGVASICSDYADLPQWNWFVLGRKLQLIDDHWNRQRRRSPTLEHVKQHIATDDTQVDVYVQVLFEPREINKTNGRMVIRNPPKSRNGWNELEVGREQVIRSIGDIQSAEICQNYGRLIQFLLDTNHRKYNLDDLLKTAYPNLRTFMIGCLKAIGRHKHGRIRSQCSAGRFCDYYHQACDLCQRNLCSILDTKVISGETSVCLDCSTLIPEWFCLQ